MAEGPFGLEVRLAYFEARLYLDGDANTFTLRQFGYSRQSASKDINIYFKRINPDCTHYCPHRKSYILDRRYKPKLLPAEKIPAFARYVDSIYHMSVGQPATRKNRRPAPKKIQRRPR